MVRRADEERRLLPADAQGRHRRRGPEALRGPLEVSRVGDGSGGRRALGRMTSLRGKEGARPFPSPDLSLSGGSFPF